jgi:hypothetical protein
VSDEPKPAPELTYGYCVHCRSVEVALVKVHGYHDFSDIGESERYPCGDGCEVCA